MFRKFNISLFRPLYMDRLTTRLPIKNAKHRLITIVFEDEIKKTQRNKEKQQKIRNLMNIMLSFNIYIRVLLDLFLEQQKNNIFHLTESNDPPNTFDERLNSLSSSIKFKFDTEKWLCNSCI